jgi:hypothetical protein
MFSHVEHKSIDYPDGSNSISTGMLVLVCQRGGHERQVAAHAASHHELTRKICAKFSD